MELILVLALAVVCGLVVLFFFLGLGRVVTKQDQNEQFHNLIKTLNESELALERQDANLPDPKTWTGYWNNLALKSGGKPNNVNTPGLFAVGLAFFAFLGGALVWPGDILGGLAFAVGGLVLLRAFYQSKIKARLVLMDKQLPNLLSGIRANLQANLTPQQAIVNQAKEIPAPLGEELRVLVEEMQVGVTLDSALRNFGQRVPSREIQFLVSAFRIAIKSGADLDPLVKSIQHIVIQRNRIANALASAVAKVQPAIWVTGVMIPAALIWSIYSSPENKEFWFSFPTGIIALGIVAVCYAAGLFIAKKQVERVKKA
jgi:tight adherence protein B